MLETYLPIDMFVSKISKKCSRQSVQNTGLIPLERFSYDLEMKTREQNRNNKRMEIERFDWFIERIQTRVAFGWLSERSRKKTSCPRTS